MILVPQDITCESIDGRPVTDPSGNPVVVSFASFIKGRLCDPVFGAGMHSLVCQSDILIASRDCKPNESMVIDLDSYQLLLAAVESPTNPYEPLIAASLLPYMRAIKEASKVS